MHTILSIGVDTELIGRVRQELSKQEFTLVELKSIRDGFEFLNINQVSLILLNNVLPGENYREFCILIRSQEKFWGMPILLIAEKAESADEKIEVLKSVIVNEYISSPVLPEEIVARINVFIELRDLQQELEAGNLLLKKLSITDDLTRLFNRRHLLERLAEELQRMKRYRYDLSCILADLDYFKKVNDRFGHLGGDALLIELADVFESNIRSIDMIGRYGGEEFLIILPHTVLERGIEVAERLRCRVRTHSFESMPGHVQTVSLGVVSFSPKDEIVIDDVIRAADEQMYLAKDGGRDRVCSRQYGAVPQCGDKNAKQGPVDGNGTPVSGQ